MACVVSDRDKTKRWTASEPQRQGQFNRPLATGEDFCIATGSRRLSRGVFPLSVSPGLCTTTQARSPYSAMRVPHQTVIASRSHNRWRVPLRALEASSRAELVRQTRPKVLEDVQTCGGEHASFDSLCDEPFDLDRHESASRTSIAFQLMLGAASFGFARSRVNPVTR
jgi:hypothetical protein